MGESITSSLLELQAQRIATSAQHLEAVRDQLDRLEERQASLVRRMDRALDLLQAEHSRSNHPSNLRR